MELAELIKVARGDAPADLAAQERARGQRLHRRDRGNQHRHRQARYCGPGRLPGPRGDRPGRPLRLPRLHRRPRAHRELAWCRPTSSPAPWCRAARPPSSPTRTKSPTCWGWKASATCWTWPSTTRSASTSWRPRACPRPTWRPTGAALYWYDLQALLHEPYVLGLGEMMNFPGVVNGAPGRAGQAARPFRAA